MVNKIKEILENHEGEIGQHWAMRFCSFAFFFLAFVLGLVAMVAKDMLQEMLLHKKKILFASIAIETSYPANVEVNLR